MPVLTIKPSGQTTHAAPGTPLLTAILAAGVELTHTCGGKAECGTCHVFVGDLRKSLPKAQRLENHRLDTVVGVGTKSRLACQALMGQEDVTVEVLDFASG